MCERCLFFIDYDLLQKKNAKESNLHSFISVDINIM